MTDAAAVPAFADAVRRWPTLEDGKRDALRKLMRLIAPDDVETRRLLQKAMRISYAYQAVASSGEDFETQGQPLLDRNCRRWTTASTAGSTKSTASPRTISTSRCRCRSNCLAANEALVDYFITRKWRADRESADPLEDERLYAIVTRKDEAPRLLRSRRSAQIIPAAQSQQMASLRSTRSSRSAAPCR